MGLLCNDRLAVAPSLTSGDLVQGRYRIVGPLGSGGMATTFRADDLVIGGQVALKLLDASGSLLDSFRSEFSLLTRLRHPNLTRVHDFGVVADNDKGSCFYTADLVEGTTLDRFALGKGWPEVVRPLADALEALGLLHLSGIRHGDFKPENVLVTQDERGVLIDLGCARPLRIDDTTGEISGTRGFIAPELLEGRRPGPRADLFSLGVTIKSLRSGLASPLPEVVTKLVERLVASDESRRPSDVAEVLEILGVDRPVRALSVAAPLLGRRRELALLSELLDALREGREAPRVLWLHGPHGAGRSRLLQEMKWTCQLRAPVFEIFHSEPDALESTLARAVRRTELSRGLDDVLEAWEQLRRGEPTILVMDDQHRLSKGQRSMLEALLRTGEATDHVLFLIASVEPPPEEPPTLRLVEVGPIGEEEVAIWSEGLVSRRNLPSLMRLSGGFPDVVEALLSSLASGVLSEESLSSTKSSTEKGMGLITRLPEDLGELTDVERRTLALLVATDGFVSTAVAERLSVSEAVLLGLHRRRWVVVETGGWRLWRVADVSALRSRLDPGLLAELHGELAEATQSDLEGLDDEEPSYGELRSRLVVHLALCGRLDEARVVLESSDVLRAPCAWTAAAEAVAEVSDEPSLQILRASIHGGAGSPDRGISILAEVLWSHDDDAIGLKARAEAARCYLKLGDLRRCLRLLRVLRRLTIDGDPRPGPLAEIDELRARALIQKGEYREAREVARGALREGLAEVTLAKLREDIGVSSSYLGEGDVAQEELRRAEELLSDLGRPRDRVRLLSYAAINEYRRGRTQAAGEAYAQALTVAEQHGLVDQIASAALNLGTARHQLGDLGRALECYERGLRTAVALGLRSTALHLRLNLAKLNADIGSFDRAASAVVRIGRDAEALEWLRGPLLSLRAQIDAGRGDIEGARGRLSEAREAFLAQEATREVGEVELERAELELRLGMTERAEGALGSAQSRLGSLLTPDLLGRIGLVSGRLLAAKGQGGKALRELERALEYASEVGHLGLEAEVEEALANVCELQGTTFLVRRHRARARELWERMAATLPSSLRDAFWQHPRLAEAGAVSDESEPVLGASRLIYLMEINRQLSSSLRAEDVLRHTMDAAIELTGAERGFVILRRERRDGGVDIQVPVARNLDREQLGRSHLKLSRSIAEQVLNTGEALLTVDALSDERFSGNVSVHAMRLRSVACVPIRSGDGILGALYLDNRFQQGRFRREEMSLLQAFADQAAIALRNATLVTALEERTRELEAERMKVEALAQAQAEEIGRLSEEVEARHSRSSSYRYDFGHIVGHGAAMHGVLSTLDRMIEAPWPVLIQGESGTGKELIARAIHGNGPREGGPFVTVNCAALPEPLLESELFGHVKGAFTGATRDRRGLFAEARGGTLLLDEIGDMPLEMQVKLLRVLEEREVRPVGSEAVIPVDVRLVCATNRRLRDEVSAGRFREDLFYRVAVMELSVPPLRARVEDIPALSIHLLGEAAGEMGREPPELSGRGLRKLARYRWPGNVRELRNVLSKALVLSRGDVINAGDIELPRAETPRSQAGSRAEYETSEVQRIIAALNVHRWNVAEVSRALGIPRSSLYRKLKRYGITAPPKDM